MSELTMRRRSCRWSLLVAVAVAWFYLLSGADQSLLAAGTSSIPKDAQEAFDKQQYAQVLEKLAKLEQEQSAASDVRRLKICTHQTRTQLDRHSRKFTAQELAEANDFGGRAIAT